MKKNLIALAIAGAFVAPTVAQASGGTTSGFVDATFTLTNDAVDTNEQQVTGFTGEVDFITDHVRVDLEINPLADQDTADSVTVEKGYVTTAIAEGFDLNVGIYGTELGLDEEDAPEMFSTTNSLITSAIRNEGALNITGLSIDADLGAAHVSVGYANDVGGVAGENTTFFNANSEVMPGIDVELGYLTQDNGDDITDLSVSWSEGPYSAFGEYAQIDTEWDTMYSVGGSYDTGSGVTVGLRYGDATADTVSANADTTLITANAAYAASDDVALILEYTSKEVGTASAVNVLSLEAIGTFGR